MIQENKLGTFLESLARRVDFKRKFSMQHRTANGRKSDHSKTINENKFPTCRLGLAPKFWSYLILVERIFLCYAGIRSIFSHAYKGLFPVIKLDALHVVVHFGVDWLLASWSPGFWAAVMTTKMFTAKTAGVWVFLFSPHFRAGKTPKNPAAFFARAPHGNPCYAS